MVWLQRSSDRYVKNNLCQLKFLYFCAFLYYSRDDVWTASPPNVVATRRARTRFATARVSLTDVPPEWCLPPRCCNSRLFGVHAHVYPTNRTRITAW